MARLRLDPQATRGINMTPLIDIIFQLMIFFIFAAKADANLMSESMRLANAPDADAYVKRHPLEIVVEVSVDGTIRIAGTELSPNTFRNVLSGAIAKHNMKFPVLIAADSKTSHKHLKTVMDICTSTGISNIRLMALKNQQ